LSTSWCFTNKDELLLILTDLKLYAPYANWKQLNLYNFLAFLAVLG